MNSTHILPYRQWIRNLVLLFLFSLCNSDIGAADFTKWVGEGGSYTVTRTGHEYQFAITGAQSSNPAVAVDKTSYGAKWTIKSYFPGESKITINYQYALENGQKAKPYYVEFTVACYDNKVSISPTSKELNGKGDYVDLKYSFSKPDKVPSDREMFWNTDPQQKVISVSQTGRVTAIGEGTAQVYLKTNLGSNQAVCTIMVKSISPTKVELDDVEVEIEKTKTLTPKLTPSNASTTFTWRSDNSNIARVNSSTGNVTGVNEGTTTIHVRTANNLEAKCNVKVVKPKFNVSSSYPLPSATNVPVRTPITITYTSKPQWAAGKNSSYVTLTNKSNNTKVAGTTTFSGYNLVFTPEKALEPQINYQLTIPANTLKDNYGTGYTSDYSLSFKTGDREKLTLSITPTDEWVAQGTKATLTASNTNATIYYTTNGSSPTSSSTVYTSPITINSNVTIKAIAKCDGYDDSEIIAQTYKLPVLKISSASPMANEDAGREVRPTITFNCKIVASDNLSSATLTRDGSWVACDFIVHEKQLVCVPNDQLKSGTYTLKLPSNAIKSDDGEPNTQYSTSFKVVMPPAYPIKAEEVDMYSGLLKSDGTFWTWGQFNAGGLGYTHNTIPTKMVDDVIDFALGGNHIAIIRSDHSLWMRGSNYKGAFGNGGEDGAGSFIKVEIAGAKKVFAGYNNSFIIRSDNSLWACGDNETWQLGDGTAINRLKPVKIMDNISMVSTGLAVSAITLDGKLYIWGQNSVVNSKVPVYITDNVKYVSVCGVTAYYIKNDGSLWYIKYEYISGSGGKYDWQPHKVMDNAKKVQAYSGGLSGTGTTIVLKTDGRLIGWGDNINGLLGNSDTSLKVEENAPITLMNSVQDFWMGAGYGFSFICGAIKQDYSVWTWGRNSGYSTNGNGFSTLGYYTKDGIYPEPHQIIESPNGSTSLSVKLENTQKLAVEQRYALSPEILPLNAIYDVPAWSSDNPNVAEVDDRGIVTAKRVGTAKITISVNGKTATCTVSVINTPTITITAKSCSREYGEANPTFIYEVSGGSITGTPKLTCTATKTSDVGSYTITVEKGTVQGNVKLVNGTLTVTKAPLTVKANDCERFVGEDNPTFTLSYSGWKNSQNESVLTSKPTATCSATKSSPAGAYPIKVSGGSAKNYSFEYRDGTLTVNSTPSEEAYYYVGSQNHWDIADMSYPFIRQSDGKTWKLIMPCQEGYMGNIADEFKIGTAACLEEGWDADMYGAPEDNPEALSGTMTRKYGPNFQVPYMEGMYSYTISIVPSTMHYEIEIKSTTASPTSRTVTISSAGYATFYDSQSAYTLPSGLTAKVVESVFGGKLTYRTLNGNVVPKGVPVMLEGNDKKAATYTLTTTQGTTTYSGTNLLQGSDETTTTTGSGLHYKLTYGPSSNDELRNVFGWYWGAQNGAPFRIEGHKAWLVLPLSVGTRAYSADGSTLAIRDVENDEADTPIYDLQGRRVQQPARKGIFVSNGKKIVNK